MGRATLFLGAALAGLGITAMGEGAPAPCQAQHAAMEEAWRAGTWRRVEALAADSTCGLSNDPGWPQLAGEVGALAAAEANANAAQEGLAAGELLAAHDGYRSLPPGSPWARSLRQALSLHADELGAQARAAASDACARGDLEAHGRLSALAWVADPWTPGPTCQYQDAPLTPTATPAPERPAHRVDPVPPLRSAVARFCAGQTQEALARLERLGQLSTPAGVEARAAQEALAAFDKARAFKADPSGAAAFLGRVEPEAQRLVALFTAHCRSGDPLPRELRARLAASLGVAARAAIAHRRYGVARGQLERAHALGPDDDTVRAGLAQLEEQAEALYKDLYWGLQSATTQEERAALASRLGEALDAAPDLPGFGARPKLLRLASVHGLPPGGARRAPSGFIP